MIEGYARATDLESGAIAIQEQRNGKLIKESFEWVTLPDEIKKAEAELKKMQKSLGKEKKEYNSRIEKIHALLDFSSQLLQTGKHSNKPVKKSQPKFIMMNCYLNKSSVYQSQITFDCL